MKTKYKIIITAVIIIAGFFSIPPTLTNICNTLEIYDDSCPRISGIQTPFGGQLRIWDTTPPKPQCFEGTLPNGTCAGPVAINLGISDSDLSHSTTENPLGIKAQVIVEPDRAILCPTKCTIPPTPHLVLTSEKGAQFVGYQVCDGISCKKDNLDDSLYVHLEQVPQNYSGAVSLEASHINLGDLPWNLGDTVHVLVKAFPVTLHPNAVVIREPEKTMVVNIGSSKMGGCRDPEQGDLSYDAESFTKRLQVENIVLMNATLKKIIDNSYCEFMSVGTLYTGNGTYQGININLNNTKNLVAQVSLQNNSVVSYELLNLTRTYPAP